MTYQEAFSEAQKGADETGYDYYVSKDAFGFNFGMLPQRKNRFGRDLSCQVVMCSDINKIKPGHGFKG
jgi:hypothetical protein